MSQSLEKSAQCATHAFEYSLAAAFETKDLLSIGSPVAVTGLRGSLVLLSLLALIAPCKQSLSVEPPEVTSCSAPPIPLKRLTLWEEMGAWTRI